MIARDEKDTGYTIGSGSHEQGFQNKDEKPNKFSCPLKKDH